MRYVIIGNSAAGIFAAEAIRKNDPEGQVDIISDEKYPAYARCLTSYYLTGKMADEDMFIRPENFYEQNKLNFHKERKAEKIDTLKSVVYTEDGLFYPYDRLLVATGASPVVPNIPGIDIPGVFTLRKLDDSKGILSFTKPGGKAVIVGGGFVSLKAAYALMKLGLHVTCVISSGQILSQMLDSNAAKIVSDLLTKKGLDIKYHNDVVEVFGGNGDHGKQVVNSVKLASGEVIAADVVIIGKGVRPNTAFLKDSGIDINKGIVVDGHMRTNCPEIYAAGDVAECYDILIGQNRINAIWPNATEQGYIAGQNMSGAETTYLGSIGMNSADFFGLSTIAAGLTKAGEDEGYEVICSFPSAGMYRRLVFKEDMLVGYILIGNTTKAGILTSLLKDRTHLKKEKDELTKGYFRQKLLW